MDIYEIAESHRTRFLQGEAKAVARIVTSYQEAEAGVKKSLAEVEAKIAAYYAAGGEPGEIAASWLNSQARYHELITQIEEELAKFADVAKEITVEGQGSSLKSGAESIADMVKPQITGGFNSLSHSAFKDMVGTLSNGSALYDLFKEIGPNAVAGARGVFGQAMVEGWNPRKTADALEETLGIARNRAVMIARTESIRAYRIAGQRQMLANQDVVEGWVWYASHTDHTCPVCLAMDGSEHPVGEIMDSHPNCRCTMVPLVKSLAGIVSEAEGQEPGEDGSLSIPSRQTGSDWFAQQAPEMQRATLGPSKYDLYAAGKIHLQDLVEDTYNDRWGRGKKERSLKSLMQMVDAGTTYQKLQAHKIAEEKAKQDAKLVAQANAIAAKLAKIEAKKKYLAEKAAAEAQIAKDAEEKAAKAAKVKQDTEHSQNYAAGWVETMGENIGPYKSPTSVAIYLNEHYPLSTITLSEIEALFKKYKVYSPEEKAAYQKRLDLKAEAEAKAKADELAQLKDIHTIQASMKLDKLSSVLALDKEFLMPSAMLNHLAESFPHHQLDWTHVSDAYEKHGVKTPAEHAAIAEAELKAKQDAANEAATKYVSEAAKAHTGEYPSASEWEKAVANLKSFFPGATITTAEVENIFKAHAPPPPQAVTKDLGYPNEHLSKDGHAFGNVELYIKYLVKEFGSEWTPAQVIAKAKAEWKTDKTGYNAKGVLAYAKKIGVEMPETSGKGKPPTVVPSTPPPASTLKLEGWKLDPESVVLGGKMTAGKAGSNDGGFYTGTDGGKYYVKFYADSAQAYNEHLANSIYRELGITTADTTVFTDSSGRTVYVSKIIENEGTLGSSFSKERAERILDGFSADVLLANWDVVGLTYDNVVKLKDNGVARIDNGGSLLYRANAGRKPLDRLNKLDEWEFFASANSKYSRVFSEAGIYGGDDLGAKAIKQIEGIDEFVKRVGGWRKYIDTTVPGMDQADRDMLVKIMERRVSLLGEKRKQIQADINGSQAVYSTDSKFKVRTFGKKDTTKIDAYLRASGEYSKAGQRGSMWFKKIWAGQTKVFDALIPHITRWTGSSKGHIFHAAARGETDVAQDMKVALATRRERWDRLVEAAGINEAPSEFTLYRGMSGEGPGHKKDQNDVAEWVIVAWQDEANPFMRALTHETASWSTHEESADRFYGSSLGVMFKATVPFENTFFDKWVDDNSFITGYGGENEVIAGGGKPNSIAVRKEDVKVRLDGIEYRYDQREAFFKAYKARFKMLPTASDIVEDLHLTSTTSLTHGKASVFGL